MEVGVRLVGLLFVLAAGCHGGAPASGDDPTARSPEPEPTVIPGAMVANTWPLLMADDATRAPFEQHPGWAALVMKRDYPAALAAFSAEPALPAGQARVHAELSAAYRQATLLAAQATVQVWAEERRDEDPPDVDCLVGLSQLILAEGEAAVASLTACAAGVDGPLSDEAAAWLGWKKAGAHWPPVVPLGATPGQPGAVAVDGLPDAGELPPYILHDLVENREIPAASPMTLLALALYHEGAAALAMGGDQTVPDALLAPWRLPMEPAEILPEGALSTEQLFGAPLLISEDAWFLADLAHGQGLPAVTAWQERAALAAAIGPCVDVAAEKVDPACAVERAGRGFDQLRGAMEISSGGEQGYHRPFADLGRLGIVRAAELAAAVAGDEKSMGLLRLNGIDLSIGSSAEPHYLLSIAAWDAHNRNSSRASETLHAQVGHIPGVEVARFPLDVLHVRLSRESAPIPPMH